MGYAEKKHIVFCAILLFVYRRIGGSSWGSGFSCRFPRKNEQRLAKTYASLHNIAGTDKAKPGSGQRRHNGKANDGEDGLDGERGGDETRF